MSGTTDDEREAMFEAAVAWHARLREPGIAPEERRAFADWLAADPHHREAHDEALRLWQALAEPAAELARDELARDGRSPRTRVAARRSRGWATAAAMAAAIAAVAWLHQGGLDDLRSDEVTAVGERRTVALPDGSEITLNTDSALALDLQPAERRARLFRGEAFFAIAPDADRPFLVETPDGAVRVLGTAFNVRIADGATVVSVAAGKVEASAGAGTARLGARQQVALAEDGLGPARAFDPVAVSAWRRGQVVFYRTRLAEVIEELNRYHSGMIVALSERARDLRVTGVFDSGDPAAAIEVIERTLGLDATRLTDRLILLR